MNKFGEPLVSSRVNIRQFEWAGQSMQLTKSNPTYKTFQVLQMSKGILNQNFDGSDNIQKTPIAIDKEIGRKQCQTKIVEGIFYGRAGSVCIVAMIFGRKTKSQTKTHQNHKIKVQLINSQRAFTEIKPALTNTTAKNPSISSLFPFCRFTQKPQTFKSIRNWMMSVQQRSLN